jgi:hypothetical protein
VTTTLADIERATARRVGPYYRAILDRQVPTTAGFETAIVPMLRSTIPMDVVTSLWLLRRGVDWQGNPVTVDPADRQRIVSLCEPDLGRVTVDRPWSVPPAPGEMVEFHHLDPELELREAVRMGLRRCLFEDRFNLGQGYIYEADLTAALPWLDDLNMVKRVQVAPFPSSFPGWSGGPADVPFVRFGQCGHVWIRVTGNAGCPYWGGLLVTVHRPHFSWVNGADAVDGPTLDDDTLNVDLNYAAAAAHIEAWHLAPARLQAAAAGNLQATRDQAALEYTRQSYVHRLPRQDNYELEQTFGYGYARPVVINA